MSERCAVACDSCETLQRAEDLVALLQSDKPAQYCAPCCLGDDTAEPQHDDRFGLVFEKPNSDSVPQSLHQMLSPSLPDRVSRHKIATRVLYFHAVNWLRKALRSGSILFILDTN